MRVFWRIIFIVIFFLAIIAVIGFARGYRFDPNQKTISSTGILAISSSPRAAKVYINGALRGVTDLNLTLSPGTYTVEIKKDGYRSYTTTIILKGELVETVDPVLFPINPSLAPLTNLGIIKAVPVDQSDKVLLFSENNPENKSGIYLFDAASRPLSFFPPLKTLLLSEKIPFDIDLSKAKVYFSFDFKQAIFEFPVKDSQTSFSYLLSLDSENQEPFDVSASKDNLLEAWKREKDAETQKILETFPKEIQQVASDSFNIVSFSPDQTKILYKAKNKLNIPLIIKPPLIAADQAPESRTLKKNFIYTYDKKEDKNYQIGDNKFDPNSLTWYYDSKRLVYNEGRQISIFLYDGQSKQIVYSGPLEEGFFSVTSDGRLLILANLNPLSNKLPDLYQVGIR